MGQPSTKNINNKKYKFTQQKFDKKRKKGTPNDIPNIHEPKPIPNNCKCVEIVQSKCN